MTRTQLKPIIALFLVLFTVISVLPLGRWASKPETYAGTIASIDRKTETVMALAATSAAVSTGLTFIPDDAATPIADKLADFAEYFLLILCVLLTEKYMLTIVGAGVFRFLIPLIFLFFGISLFRRNNVLCRLAVKMAAFGLIVSLTIPLGIWVSDMVYDTYRFSIDNTIAAAEELSQETEALSTAKDKEGIFSILDKISETVSGLTRKASRILSSFMQSLAVLVVTACVIPLLVMAFLIWFIKLFTGTEVSIPIRYRFLPAPEADPE